MTVVERTYEEMRAELLAAAERKPVRTYLQIDGFHTGGAGVSVDVVHELRNLSGVRIQIHEDVSIEDAKRVLTKMVDAVDLAYDNAEEQEDPPF